MAEYTTMRDDELYLMDRAKVHRTVTLLLELFVKGDYASIARVDTKGLPVDMMRDEINRWPSRFTMPPEDKLDDLIDVVVISNTNPQAWSVNVDFWTEQEGHSDLTLVLTLTDSAGEYYTVEIDDIEVL